MATSLSDLTTIPTVQSIFDGEIAPVLRSNNVRVTDWTVGGVYRAMAFAAATMWQEGRTALATLAAAGLGDYVFGFSAVPSGVDVSSWVTPYAKQVYGVDRIQATQTVRTFALVNASANTYGPIAAGALIVQNTVTGLRYKNAASLTIAPSATTTASFASEFAVNTSAGLTYTEGTGSTWQIVTAQYPGVTATNPASTYSTVSSSGAGTGTLALSGSPTGVHSYAIRIDSAGVVGGGAWSTSIDGSNFASAGTIGTLVNLGGTGLTVTPADNGGSPSFPAGAYFYFSVPGSDVTQVGRDQETPQALGARCYALYPSLAFAKDSAGNWIPTSPTLAAYVALAYSASSQVKVAFAKTDGTINNQVNVVIAGQGALVPSSVLATVQSFFNSFSMLTDLPVVSSPTANALTFGGATVKYKTGALAATQAAMTARFAAYVAGVDTSATLSINGLVDRSYLITLMRTTPNVTYVNDGLTINGAAADLQLPTSGTYGLATWDGVSANPLSSAFTWIGA